MYQSRRPRNRLRESLIMIGEKIDLESCSGSLLSPTLFGAEAAQGSTATTEWQGLDSPPVGPADNIFAEPRPEFMQGSWVKADAEHVPQQEPECAGISQVQAGEHHATALTTEQGPQQPGRRRERGFDPRRASVAMSSNFALHTAGDGLLGDEEIVVLAGRPPASSASASFRAAMRAANSAYTGRPSGLAGSALDAHRPPPLSVHAEGEGEGGMPPAAAAGISPVITESPVAACGPPRSLPLRGRPPAQQSVAMRDSMALFLQLEGAVEQRAGYTAEEVIQLASAAKASRGLPSIAEGAATTDATGEEPGPAEGVPSPVAACAGGPRSGQQGQAMRGSMALFLQLEGAISGKTPMKPAEVLAMDGGNATLPAAEDNPRMPAPPALQSSAEDDGDCAAAANAEAALQQEEQAEQQRAEADRPAPLGQGAMAPFAIAAPAQPLEEAANHLALLNQAAAGPLQAHHGRSPARFVQSQPLAARTLKPSSFPSAAAQPSKLRRPAPLLPPKVSAADARTGASAAPRHSLLSAAARQGARSGIPTPAPVAAQRAARPSGPLASAAPPSSSRRAPEPPVQSAAATTSEAARTTRLPLSPKGASAGNRIPLQRRLPSPAKGEGLQALGPLAEGRLRVPAPAQASSPVMASRVAVQPNSSVRTSPASKLTPQTAPRRAPPHLSSKTPTPMRKSPHFERMLEEAMQRGDAAAFTGKGAAVKNSPLEGKPHQGKPSRPTAEQRHFQEYAYGE